MYKLLRTQIVDLEVLVRQLSLLPSLQWGKKSLIPGKPRGGRMSHMGVQMPGQAPKGGPLNGPNGLNYGHRLDPHQMGPGGTTLAGILTPTPAPITAQAALSAK